ncbi:MAG: hypothetical protein WD716_04460 [Fimbriimonadaceae bacterium]
MGAKKGLLPWVAGMLALGVLGLVLYEVSLHTDRAYVCENTGSHIGFREWPNGARTRPWYRVSPLEEFMKKQYPGVMRHRWTSYAGTGKNVIGTPRSFGHGSPGAVLHLKDETAEAWIANHSETEVRALYDSLATSNPTTADAIVKKINDEVSTYTD